MRSCRPGDIHRRRPPVSPICRVDRGPGGRTELSLVLQQAAIDVQRVLGFLLPRPRRPATIGAMLVRLVLVLAIALPYTPKRVCPRGMTAGACVPVPTRTCPKRTQVCRCSRSACKPAAVRCSTTAVPRPCQCRCSSVPQRDPISPSEPARPTNARPEMTAGGVSTMFLASHAGEHRSIGGESILFPDGPANSRRASLCVWLL